MYTVIFSGKGYGMIHPQYLYLCKKGKWGYNAECEALEKKNIEYPETNNDRPVFKTVDEAYKFICAMDEYFPHFWTNMTLIVPFKEYDFSCVRLPNWNSIVRDSRNRVMEITIIDR